MTDPGDERATPGRLLTAPIGTEPIDLAVEALRRLIRAVTDGHRAAVESDNQAAAKRLRSVSSRLAGLAVDGPQAVRTGPPRSTMAPRYSPVAGSHNALAPPLSLYSAADGWVTGTVRFSSAYQSAAGALSHGSALVVFDVALAIAARHAGHPGMTAELQLSSIEPVPIGALATVRARSERVEDRKNWVAGEMLVDGRVCFQARGLFIGSRRKPVAE
jgi:hypothetical protein